LGPAVKTVKEDAVGEAGGRVVAGGEGPDGFGGDGGLADAAGAAEGDYTARLQVGEELGQFAFAVGKVLGAGGAVEGGSVGVWGCGGRGVKVDAAFDVGAVAYDADALCAYVVHHLDPPDCGAIWKSRVRRRVVTVTVRP
jgi:hypothetical protein